MIAHADLVAELEREHRFRSELGRKGRCEPAKILVMAEILGDVLELVDPETLACSQGRRPGCVVTWSSKLKELDLELSDRRLAWPDRVAKGRMTQADADQAVARLEAVRDLYWRKMLAWENPLGPIGDRRLSEWLEPVRQHVAAVETEAAGSGELFEGTEA